MKKILTLVAFALILGMGATFAQQHQVASKNPKTESKIGDKFYAEGYFYTAAEYYKDVVRQDSSSRYGNYWLAMALLKSKDYEGAETFFRKFYDLKPGEKTNKKRWEEEDAKLFNEGEFYFGTVLHRNGKYDEAIEHLNKFSAKYVPVNENDNLKKLAALEISGSEFSKTAPKSKVKIFNAGAGVNKAYGESAPFGLGEKDLYYSSIKGEGNSLIFVEGPKSKVVYQEMHSTKSGETWGPGEPVANKDLNEDGFIVGNGTFNHDATRFYFTKCLEVDDDRPLCNIFVADHKDGSFSNISRLPEPINEKEKYTATQPAVRTSEDGMEIVYFVSDRPGGSGGLDIWYFNRAQNGEFKGPKVLKGGINTPGD